MSLENREKFILSFDRGFVELIKVVCNGNIDEIDERLNIWLDKTQQGIHQLDIVLDEDEVKRVLDLLNNREKLKPIDIEGELKENEM